MNILKNAIVSTTEVVKNYKTSRDKAEELGKIFIFKNNQPDAVLLSIKEYEKIAAFMEYLNRLEDQKVEEIIGTITAAND